MKRAYTLSEAAALVGVSCDTLNKWRRMGAVVPSFYHIAFQKGRKDAIRHIPMYTMDDVNKAREVLEKKQFYSPRGVMAYGEVISEDVCIKCNNLMVYRSSIVTDGGAIRRQLIEYCKYC
jgi:hypothetical protein